MTARLFRAQTRLPLGPWRRQHRLYWSDPARCASVRDFSCLITASTLHPFSRGSCCFHSHALPAISLTLMTQNQAHASTSPARNDPWLNHHSNGSCWDGGLTWLTLTCDPSRSRRLEYVRKYARGFETVFDGYHHALDDFCVRMPRDLPAENAVWRFFARLAANRDILTQEAPNFLLGNHLVDA
jgi:hypothetical protein